MLRLADDEGGGVANVDIEGGMGELIDGTKLAVDDTDAIAERDIVMEMLLSGVCCADTIMLPDNDDLAVDAVVNDPDDDAEQDDDLDTLWDALVVGILLAVLELLCDGVADTEFDDDTDGCPVEDGELERLVCVGVNNVDTVGELDRMPVGDAVVDTVVSGVCVDVASDVEEDVSERVAIPEADDVTAIDTDGVVL